MKRERTPLSFLKMEYQRENNMNPNLTARELEQMDRHAKRHNKIATINNKVVDSIEKKLFGKEEERTQSLEEINEMEK